MLCAWKPKRDKHLSAETSQHITKRAAVGEKHGFQPPVTACSFEYAQSKHLAVERRLKRSSTFTATGARWNQQGHKDLHCVNTHILFHPNKSRRTRNAIFAFFFFFLPSPALTAAVVAVHTAADMSLWACVCEYDTVVQYKPGEKKRRQADGQHLIFRLRQHSRKSLHGRMGCLLTGK